MVQDEVLRNVRDHLTLRWPQLTSELRARPTPAVRTFLDETGIDLAQVLRQDKSFTTLRRDAGLLPGAASPVERRLVRRVRAVAHVDDPGRAHGYDALLRNDTPYERMSAIEQRFARMLFFSLWPDGGGFGSYQQGLDAVRAETVG